MWVGIEIVLVIVSWQIGRNLKTDLLVACFHTEVRLD